ncbi:TOMM precursor leader peptide-binding protein [Niallia endozanthoxylica]|uniref:TOMM precursor leader peptide-binding protein n=1 Tax=Niallia endozanthoxylica TaxID=2036016 RepID=UPI001CC414D1|nr:TOMM precursor leader peptide-binding protein [Niallia endozanthoxylica]
MNYKCNLEKRVFITNLRTLTHSSYLFLPDSLCPNCRSLPNNTAELAQIKLESSPKINGNGYQCRAMDE